MERLVKIVCVLFLIFSLIGCNAHLKEAEELTGETTYLLNEEDELRAVWISFYELSMENNSNKSEKCFIEKTEKMFSNICAFGLNTVIVHVRPFSDAFYKSAIFPWSKYITGEQGVDPGYDPLKIMVETAHKYGLKIHAWINPYRVIYSTDFSDLAENNPARIWHEDEKAENNTYTFVTDTGIFYNPTVQEVQKLIIDGIKEIATNYNVDGIHMDDYFYPDTSAEIDKKQYEEYLSSGGNSSLENWRRENINAFVSGAYSAIKSINNEIKFGISPAGNIENNLNSYFADVVTWGSIKGYVDYLMPQIYFGFENKKLPFVTACSKWQELVTCKEVELYFGLPLYKSGNEDENAGKHSEIQDSGRYEFINNSDVISRQLNHIRRSKKYNGFSIYSYSDLFDRNFSEITKKEVENLKNML